MAPPNILVIVTDQQRQDSLGCYGNRIVRTPHLDRLAREGVVCDNAFVANPVCMPSRASLLTGRHPNRHGLISNGVALPLTETTLPEVLRRNGYRTAAAGKLHLTPHAAALDRQSPESRAWWQAGKRLPFPYYGFESVQLCCAHGGEDWADYGQDLARIDPDLPSLISEARALHRSGAPSSWKAAMPVEHHSSTWVADRAIRYIENFAKAREPFFLFAGFPDPHFPYAPPEPYASLYDPASVPMPNRSREEAKTASEELRNRWQKFEKLFGYPPQEMPETHVREIIAHTYGMVTLIDDNVGRILDALASAGIQDDTIVLFLSDHGEHLGDHYLIYKCINYDELIRVPLIWRLPGRFRPGHRVDGLLSLIDVMPTLLEMAGIDPPRGVQGSSLRPALEGNPWEGRGWALVEGDDVDPDIPLASQPCSRTLRTADFSITWYSYRKDGELFDLRRDPQQRHNLWQDAAYLRVRHDLIIRLLDCSVQATRDNARPLDAPS